jgi:hypothetical protein
MNRRDSEQEQAAALEAYRAAAHAEADAHFDDRALDAQRHKILARLAHLGQTAKVIRFPLSSHVEAPASGINRRWITLAAAAGLIIGLLGGQLVHLLPQSQQRRPSPMATALTPASTASPTAGPTRALFSFPQDDGLLDEVDFAVQVRSASELRALDELTPLHDQH